MAVEDRLEHEHQSDSLTIDPFQINNTQWKIGSGERSSFQISRAFYV